MHLIGEIDKIVEGFKDEEDQPAIVEILNRAPQRLYSVPVKAIFWLPPHISADNHFSGNYVMSFMGRKGYGIAEPKNNHYIQCKGC